MENSGLSAKNDASEDPEMNGMKKEKFRTWKELTKNQSGKMTMIVVEDKYI